MARLNLTVPEEKKAKWAEAAKEHPEAGGNVSALIRYSVNRELEGNSSGEVDSEEVLSKLGDLGDKLNEVNGRLDSMDSRLSSLETQSTEEPEIGDLSGEVFDLLPEIEPGTTEWQQEKTELQQELEHTESESVRTRLQAWEGTPEGLSKALDEPEYMVSNAIEKLQTDTHLVRSTDDGRFYKVA